MVYIQVLLCLRLSAERKGPKGRAEAGESTYQGMEVADGDRWALISGTLPYIWPLECKRGKNCFWGLIGDRGPIFSI